MTTHVGGIKGRYFSGGNASGKPLVALIFGIWAVSYTIDYHSAFTFLPVMTLLTILILVHLSSSFYVCFCYTLFNRTCRTPQESRALDVASAYFIEGYIVAINCLYSRLQGFMSYEDAHFILNSRIPLVVWSEQDQASNSKQDFPIASLSFMETLNGRQRIQKKKKLIPIFIFITPFPQSFKFAFSIVGNCAKPLSGVYVRRLRILTMCQSSTHSSSGFCGTFT